MFQIITRLIPYLQLYKKDLFIVLFAIFGVSSSLLMFGYVFRKLIDTGINSNYDLAINQYIYLIYIIIFIFAFSSFLRSYFINNITSKVISKIKIQIYSKLMNLDIVTFEEMKIGDIIARFSVDTEYISQFLMNFLSFFVRNTAMLCGGLILMFFQSVKLSFITCLIIPILLLPLLRFARYVRSLSKNALNMQGLIVSNIEESFSNIHTFHAFNQQQNKINYFTEQTDEYLINASKRFKVRALFFALSITIILSVFTLVIWIGSKDILKGYMSSGQVLSFIYYAIITGVSLGSIMELFSQLQSPIAAIERVFELVDINLPKATQIKSYKSRNILLQQDVANANHAISVISFKNVDFSYPSRPNIKILDQITFDIEHGKFTGIIGKSGIGKSTIMQLILKFYAPNSGVIRYHNNELSMTDTEQIRDMIAYVPQEVSIFSSSIKDNIAIAKPNASDSDIIHAADIACVTDFANLFTNGLDTEIGARGVKLSGGQKQRIGIARAILRSPQILLFDEATSSLDDKIEQKLLITVSEFMKNKTIISIAHRLSSIKDADEILVIDQGKVIEKVTYQEVSKHFILL